MGAQVNKTAFLLLCILIIKSTADRCPFTLYTSDEIVTINVNGIELFKHDAAHPAIFVGRGQSTFKEHLGNFDIQHYTDERIALQKAVMLPHDTPHVLIFSRGDLKLEMTLSCDTSHPLTLTFGDLPPGYDRVWFRLRATSDERVYGAGEQFSFFDLKGHTFPIWTREQGNGRNKSTLLTFLCDVYGPMAGGDYHTTYFPQPTFLSKRGYYFHIDGYHYSEFDFTHSNFHEIFHLGNPGRLHIQTGNLTELVTRLTAYIGRPPLLPDWTQEGIILGVQGGTNQMLKYLKMAQKAGIHVTGLWIQDWAGRLDTSFGQRLFWNWKWDSNRYPRLKEVIAELKEEGIRVLGYASPNLNTKGDLFAVAESKGYFAKDNDGKTYTTNFGEFMCGFIDFTNPKAYTWYKDEILKKNMLGLGLSGWMADFAEYVPVDMVFSNGQTGLDIHNEFPVMWARMNREAVEETGNLGNVMFFMRSGNTGTAKYSTMMWAGDQSVDFSYDDGLASTVPAALSMGMSGMGLTHYDIGQYHGISNISLVRSQELLLRSAEVAVFTTMMRTHEGNIPAKNWQIYSSDETMEHFAIFVDQFRALRPYRELVLQEVTNQGLPAQRPLFLHYPNDEQSWSNKYQYLFGPDLLVAPVIDSKVETKTVFLPDDEWVHLYTGTVYTGPKEMTVDAPIGQPAVFYKSKSEWVTTFNKLRDIQSKADTTKQGYCHDKDCPDP